MIIITIIIIITITITITITMMMTMNDDTIGLLNVSLLSIAMTSLTGEESIMAAVLGIKFLPELVAGLIT